MHPKLNIHPQYFTFITWKEDKYYVAQCLNVDVSSFGKTHEEAMENLKEAIDLYLEDAPKEAIIEIEQPAISVREFQYA